MKYHQNPDTYKMGEVGYIHWNKSPQPNVPRKPHHWQSITTQKQSSTGPSVNVTGGFSPIKKEMNASTTYNEFQKQMYKSIMSND